MRRRLGIAMLAGLAALGALGLLAVTAPGAVTRAQKFFADELVKDTTVSREVRNKLRNGTWRVDRDIVFSDLTGDGKSDAVVRVYSGTAAQDVALYVFSSKAGRKLRVVHRAEDLYRVTVSVRSNLLRVTTPQFKAGDPPCCPSAYVERAYRWRKDAFVLANRRTIQSLTPNNR